LAEHEPHSHSNEQHIRNASQYAEGYRVLDNICQGRTVLMRAYDARLLPGCEWPPEHLVDQHEGSFESRHPHEPLLTDHAQGTDIDRDRLSDTDVTIRRSANHEQWWSDLRQVLWISVKLEHRLW
jgi:hypothetical protein